MDIVITASPSGKAWAMTDLLGRNMGHVRETELGTFIIEPAGHAVETMGPLMSTPYASLDAALAAIEEHTRGTCRRAPA